MYLYLKYTVYVCSLSGPGLAPGVLSYFYTQHSTLKPARLIMPRQNRKKVRDISRGGGLQKNVHMTFLVDKIVV